jgi:hypothetical protein
MEVYRFTVRSPDAYDVGPPVTWATLSDLNYNIRLPRCGIVNNGTIMLENATFINRSTIYNGANDASMLSTAAGARKSEMNVCSTSLLRTDSYDTARSATFTAGMSRTIKTIPLSSENLCGSTGGTGVSIGPQKYFKHLNIHHEADTLKRGIPIHGMDFGNFDFNVQIRDVGMVPWKNTIRHYAITFLIIKFVPIDIAPMDTKTEVFRFSVRSSLNTVEQDFHIKLPHCGFIENGSIAIENASFINQNNVVVDPDTALTKMLLKADATTAQSQLNVCSNSFLRTDSYDTRLDGPSPVIKAIPLSAEHLIGASNGYTFHSMDVHFEADTLQWGIPIRGFDFTQADVNIRIMDDTLTTSYVAANMKQFMITFIVIKISEDKHRLTTHGGI